MTFKEVSRVEWETSRKVNGKYETDGRTVGSN